MALGGDRQTSWASDALEPLELGEGDDRSDPGASVRMLSVPRQLRLLIM